MPKIQVLFARSPRAAEWIKTGSPFQGVEALTTANVFHVEQLNESVLHGTEGFGKTSLAYLTLVLADEVLRLNRVIGELHNYVTNVKKVCDR
jgi:replication-associated recombination protein RarA